MMAHRLVMAPRRTLSPAALPRWEISLYWLLSLASHLYSFYELHKFSREYEAGLDREFELERGFLIWGFKKDPTDFEWSFWSEWAKGSLLWSFLGHAIISWLSGVFAPGARVATLTVYGLVTACHLLGIRGLAVVLFHMGVSFCVAQLRKPALCWACALVLLSTLHLDFLEELQMRATDGTFPKLGFLTLLASAARIFLWWLLAETMVHLMYIHAIQNNETYLEILPPWALGGLALALVQFFYVKYLVLFGLPALLARLDGLEPPRLPRCVSTMYSFAGMWRHFDVGLYHWLLRYVYLPLGGSQKGRLRKMLSAALAFAFVCYWHGGHDYLRDWALMNWAGVMAESAVKSFLSSPYVSSGIESRLSPPMRRRSQAFLSAFSTAMLILSNLVFLGGHHVGRVFWKRIFLHGCSTVFPPVLLFLYCYAQIGLEWDKKQNGASTHGPVDLTRNRERPATNLSN